MPKPKSNDLDPGLHTVDEKARLSATTTVTLKNPPSTTMVTYNASLKSKPNKTSLLTAPQNFVLALLAVPSPLPPTPTASLSPNHTLTYSHPILSLLILQSATLTPTPTVAAHLIVPSYLCNSTGTLHGGAFATIFDLCTTLPLTLIRQENWWESTGVTRSLEVEYLGQVHVGEKIEVEAWIDGLAGPKSAKLRGIMRKVEKEVLQDKQGRGGDSRDGEVVAKCVQVKFNADSIMYGKTERIKKMKMISGKAKL